MVNKGEYTVPWSRQKALKEQFENYDLPTIDELADRLHDVRLGKVNQGMQSRRARALFAMYYLTGCRVTEILKTPILRKQTVHKKVVYTKQGIKKVLYALRKNGKPIVKKYEVKHNYDGLRKRDIHFTEIDGHRCMVIRTENRKNKKRRSKRLPIPIEKEKKIAWHVYNYIKDLPKDAIIFPFGSKRATQIVNEISGFNIHFIRHIRATHLITVYDYNEQALVRFMGWSDSTPAKHYLELKSSDLFREFYKGGKR